MGTQLFELITLSEWVCCTVALCGDMLCLFDLDSQFIFVPSGGAILPTHSVIHLENSALLPHPSSSID